MKLRPISRCLLRYKQPNLKGIMRYVLLLLCLCVQGCSNIEDNRLTELKLSLEKKEVLLHKKQKELDLLIEKEGVFRRIFNVFFKWIS